MKQNRIKPAITEKRDVQKYCIELSLLQISRGWQRSIMINVRVLRKLSAQKKNILF